MIVELKGGPADGRVIDLGEQWHGMLINVPALFPSRHDAHALTEPRFYAHQYHLPSGLYYRGKMPNDRITIGGTFTWFGPRLERWLRRYDNRHRD